MNTTGYHHNWSPYKKKTVLILNRRADCDSWNVLAPNRHHRSFTNRTETWSCNKYYDTSWYHWGTMGPCNVTKHTTIGPGNGPVTVYNQGVKWSNNNLPFIGVLWNLIWYLPRLEYRQLNNPFFFCKNTFANRGKVHPSQSQLTKYGGRILHKNSMR